MMCANIIIPSNILISKSTLIYYYSNDIVYKRNLTRNLGAI